MYAAGKIPGSFFRREGRPGELAILTCRLTDRPLRPSFPAGFRNEVQVIATIMGADQENPHDIASINGASAALMVSGIPFNGPIGAVRLAHHNGEWIAHPTFQEGDDSTFELVVAGRRLDDGDVAIMMVEAGGTEKSWDIYEAGAPKVTEELIAGGLEESKKWINASIELQLELREGAGSARPDRADPVHRERRLPARRVRRGEGARRADDRRGDGDRRQERPQQPARRDPRRHPAALVGSPRRPASLAEQAGEVKKALRSLQKEVVRRRIVNEGVRIDGRGTADIRPLSAEVGVLDTAHGTRLFQRGETQVLAVTTLGMPRMEQMLDTITTDERKRYMHHYNFAPFSTGETGRVGSPKRREIGHGALAERALLPVVPSAIEWPYTLRVVSDVLASNGSTSMASVCGSTLSLMDAGVPIKAPVAGIAMGLVFARGQVRDPHRHPRRGGRVRRHGLQGRRHRRSSSPRCSSTRRSTASPPTCSRPRCCRRRKPGSRSSTSWTARSSAPRDEVRDTAPKIVSFEIPIDKIGEVIGPKGKVINTIQQETGADISVQDDDGVGIVSIGSKDGDKVEEAQRRIELILDPPTAEVGAVYKGRVVNITKFGAFVNILPGRDGLIHISKLGRGKRIDRVEDVLSLGEELAVKVDDIDQNGKLSLSLVGDDGDDGGDGGGGGGNASGPRDRDRESRAPRDDRPPRESRRSSGELERVGERVRPG